MPRIELVRLFSARLAIAALALASAGPAIAAGVAQFSRTFVSFGFVPHDIVSQVQPVFVTNIGDAVLDIAGLNLSGAQAAAYFVAGTCGPPMTLAPGARCRIDLTMRSPTSIGPAGAVNATLTVQASTGAADIALRGAVDPGFDTLAFVATPSYLDIPAQAVGTPAAAQTLQVTNRTDETFTLPQMTLVGGDVGDFTLASDCAAGQSFAPGQTCTSTMTFTPQAAGPRSTEVTFQPTLHGIAGSWRFSITGIGGAAAPVTVVEYYNAVLDHYFITWVPAEQANLDAGNTPTRWTRTGFSFRVYTAAQAGTSPVCRYYLPPAFGDSHFFGRGTVECNATGAAHPAFVLEDPAFMHVYLPAGGVCPAATTPVYRAFSNRADANHRYMTDRTVRDQMVARGWLAEGDGPDLVVMCSP